MSIPTNHESALQVIHYLLNKRPQTTKLNVVKLAFLADKIHLLRYARTITHDEFYALPHGPIGTNVLNICNLNAQRIAPETVQEASRFIEVLDNRNIRIRQQMEYDLLSQTDTEILDYVLETFGNRSDLVAFLHKFPEWKRFEEALVNHRTRQERITIESMFELPDFEAHMGVSIEEAEQSKEIASEAC